MTREELEKLEFDTQMIRATAKVDFSEVRSHIPPLFQTVNFDYDSVDDGMAVFSSEKKGYFYSRNGNPTSELFASLVAMLERSETAIATSSGMSAISTTFLSLLKAGDEIVSASQIYGGTRTWMRDHLSTLDIHTKFVDITCSDEIKNAISEKTKVIYCEVLGNPNLVVADIKRLAQLAHDNNALFIIDNTFTPPPIIRPLELGADLVIHSATKYISGHGDVIGGIVAGSHELVDKVEKALKLYGGVISPFNAWLAIRGLKTLGVRMQRHNENAQKIAEFLLNHTKVESVHYPGLPSHPQHELAKSQLEGFSGMMAFEVKGGLEAGKNVMGNVKVCNFTTSLGEFDTLVIHPATTSHKELTKEEREAIGITDGLVRLSVGIENINDIIVDLKQAIDKS